MWASKFAARAIVLLFLVSTIAAAQDRRTDGARKTLHELFSAEWDYQMEQYPTWASTLGDRRWNDRWSDSSFDAISRRHDHDIETLTKLLVIDRNAL